MSSERNIWGDLPADPRALRLSIAELERAEGLCLHEIENEVSYLESVDLVLHEVKRLRWRPIDTVPRDHFPRLVWSPAIGRCVAFLDVTWTWWPVPAIEPLPSAPTHWRPLEPAPCDGSGEAGETEGLDPKGNSAVPEGQAPSSIDQDYPTPAPSQQRGERS